VSSPAASTEQPKSFAAEPPYVIEQVPAEPAATLRAGLAAEASNAKISKPVRIAGHSSHPRRGPDGLAPDGPVRVCIPDRASRPRFKYGPQPEIEMRPPPSGRHVSVWQLPRG